EDAGQEERAMRAEEALREEKPQMLQVALTPASVALHLLEQRRRHFLPAAAEVVRQPDAPAGASHERRLDEIVAEDLATERLPSPEPRQAAVRHEGRDADDRVVSPVLSVAELPPVQPGGEHRPVDMTRELLDAREQRAAVHRHGGGLDHADMRVDV